MRNLFGNLFEILLFLFLPVITLGILLLTRCSVAVIAIRWIIENDLYFYFGIIVIYVVWWRLQKGRQEQWDVHERALGAQVLRSQVSITMVTTGILIPICLLFVEFGKRYAMLAESVLRDVYIAIFWFAASITVGIWVVASITTQVNKENVARNPMYVIPATGQLFAVFFGILRIANAALALMLT